MKINYFSSTLCFFIIVALCALYFRQDIQGYLDDFAIKSAQQQFGSQELASEQEDKIRHIAAEMKITDHFLVRKMNSQSLRTFGYYNAFVYFFQFLNFIPLTNTPILFVSEGFFDDLSNQEQRFLIGHELVHIQERHTQYLNLIIYFIMLLIAILCLFYQKRFISFMQDYYVFKYSGLCTQVVFGVLVYSSCMVPVLGGYAYRKHIEFIADHRSLTSLKEFDGALKLIYRWNKEFKFPLHNSWYGFFSDHPSCHDRIAYCLHLKNNYKEVS